MPPIATSSLNGHSSPTTNGNSSLKATAPSFQPAVDRYHASSSQSAMDTEATYAAHNYHPLPIVFARASGAQVWDPEGKEYLDFLSAYSAVNQGHCHPELIKTLTEQASRLTLSSRAFYNDVFPKFAETITKMLGFDMVLPMNTGAEAVETAVKIARKWGYKKKGIPHGEALVFSAQENFHGRTFAAITMSSDPESRDNYGPYLPGVGCVCPATKKALRYDNVDDLREALEVHGKNTAAFIVEPIQGEAGIVVPADDYLQKVKALCEEYNVLLICDEIQTGIARTGRMLCSEWSGIKPDLVLLGKALGGGMMPVSAVVGSREVMMVVEPGTHGSTFGGNPLASAIAIRALQIVEKEGLVERAEHLGNVLRDGLRAIDSPIIKLVRGKGLLNAIVINEEATNGHSAWDLCMLLKARGVLVGKSIKDAHIRSRAVDDSNNDQAKPTHRSTIRLAPPLVISEDDLKRAISIIRECIEELPTLKGKKEDEIIPPPEKGVVIGLED